MNYENTDGSLVRANTAEAVSAGDDCENDNVVDWQLHFHQWP